MRQRRAVGRLRASARAFLVAALLLLLLVTGVVGSPHIAGATALPAPTLRLMAMGDSITHGSTSAPSYRRSLWQQLQQGQFDVDFVGGMNSGSNG